MKADPKTPTVGRMRGGPLTSLWRTRWLLAQWIRRDFTVQYRQSLLGLAWAMAQPLVLLLVYGTVFRNVLDVDPPGESYAVFALCGLVPWTFASSTVIRSVSSLANASTVVKQVYFPRSIVALASTGVTLVDLFVATVILLVTQAVAGGGIHLATIALVPIYLSLLLLLGAVAVVFSIVGALVRDLRFVMPLVLQVAFIATPIVYPRDLAPERYDWIYDVNPMVWVIDAVRSAVVEGRFPDARLLAGLLAGGALALVVALRYSAAVEDRLPDLL